MNEPGSFWKEEGEGIETIISSSKGLNDEEPLTYLDIVNKNSFLDIPEMDIKGKRSHRL